MDNIDYQFDRGFEAGVASQQSRLIELTLRLEAFEKGDVVPGPDFRRLESINRRQAETITKLDQIIIRFVEEKGPLCSAIS